jgi:hypothetical protein
MAPLTPPPAADDMATQVPDVPRTGMEKVGGFVSAATGRLGRGTVTGGDDSRNSNLLDDAIQKHHQQRLDEARMHRQNYQTYASALATGTDPQTGEPLSPEKQQQYQTWKDASWAAYTKLAGVTKETKAALQKQGAIVDTIIQHGQQSRQGQGGGGAPSATGAGGVAAGGGGGGNASPAGLTPPPAPPGAAPPGPSGADAAAINAPAVRQGITDNREFNLYKRQQDLLHQHKMEEQKALQTAKGQSGPRPRPQPFDAVSMLDARKVVALGGEPYLDEKGRPIDIENLPDNMALKGAWVRNDDGKWDKVYTTISPNQRTVTVGNETFAVSPMDISKLNNQAVGADLGQHITPKSGTHQAVAIGPDGKPTVNTLTSTSTPTTPGVSGRSGGGGKNPRPSSPTPPPAGATAKPSAAGSSRGSAVGSGTAAPGGSGNGGSGGAIRGLPPGTYNQMLQRVTPPRLAATQLFGDPATPSFKPLAAYGAILDDPASRDRVASAWNLIRDHMDKAGADEHSGDLVTLMRNYAGIPGAVAESEAEKMTSTLDALKPREAEMLNRLFSTYGTIIGLRSLTKGSAAKFSAKNMEQEVPVPSMNVRNSRQFYDKLQTLAEEVNTGFYGVPEQMFRPGERAYDKKQQEELSKLARGEKKTPTRGGAAAATTTPESAADEYIRKHTKPSGARPQ